MFSKPTLRHQADGRQEQISRKAAIDFTHDPGDVRQEYKDEADVKTILRRFGVGNVPQKPITYDTADFDMDLQQAMQAVDSARDMHSRLPQALRDKYPTWQSVLNGLYNGQFRIDLENTEVERPADRWAREQLSRAEQRAKDEQALRDIQARNSQKEDTTQ